MITLIPTLGHSELIRPERRAAWEAGVTVGVPGGIPKRTNLINVTEAPYLADATGATDTTARIQAAIDAAKPSDVVYLPAGTYRCDGTLVFNEHRDDITLRGAGMNLTRIDSHSQSRAFYVGSSIAEPRQEITGARARGTSTLNVADTSTFAVGRLVQIFVADQRSEAAIVAGAAPIIHVSNWPMNRRMNAIVTAKTTSTVTISPSLYFDCSNLQTLIEAYPRQTDGVGIEDLTIDATNGQLQYGIYFAQAYRCWTKGVKLFRVKNFALYWENSLHCEARECVISDRALTAGPNGAGLLSNTSSACLFEDNIVDKFFPSVEMNFGSTGNVIAYNLLEDPRSGEIVGGALNINHGPHNSFNLYEGNVTPSIQSDGYYGSSSEDTIFRNWVHGKVLAAPDLTGYTMRLNRLTRNYNVIANIVANGTQWGLPNIGNDRSVGTAQPTAGQFWEDWPKLQAAAVGAGPGPSGFQEIDLDVVATSNFRGNHYVTSADIPSTERPLGTDVLPDSLFRPSRPTYFGTLQWPPFDPANPTAVGYDRIPAGYRYLHGKNPPGTSADEIAPTAPATLTSNATSATQVSVTWTAAADNVAVALYRIERSQSANSPAFNQVGTSATTTFSDSGLTASTTYNYRVRATDEAGNLSVYSPVSTVTTPAAPSDTIAPTVPANLSITSGSWSETAVTWIASTDNLGVTGYRLERSQGAGSTAFAQIATPTTTSFADSGLTASTVYNYRVRAADAIGNLSDYSSVATITTGAGPDIVSPTAPQSVTAVVSGATQIDLSWTPSTDEVGVAGYRVERSEGLGSTTFGLIASPTTPNVTDGGLKASTAYNYRVRSVDAAGNLSLDSAVASVSTPAPPSDTTAPSVPGSLSALSSDSTSQLKLTWAASTDNGGVTGYQIERSQGSGSTEFTQVAVATAPAYDDQGLTAATAYNYRVRAVDAAGNLSGYSNVATATTAPVPEDKLPPTAPASLLAEPTGGGQITLSWGPASDNVSVIGYNVERSNDTVFVPVATSGATTYADKQLTSSTTYKYRVRAVDGAGNPSDYSNVAEATTTSGPKRPSNLRVKGPK